MDNLLKTATVMLNTCLDIGVIPSLAILDNSKRAKGPLRLLPTIPAVDIPFFDNLLKVSVGAFDVTLGIPAPKANVASYAIPSLSYQIRFLHL